MKTFELKGVTRSEIGKKATKQLRKNEHIPCVLYGGEAPVHFSAPVNDFRKLLYTPNVYLIDLDIDGTTCMAIMQDLQFHPVTDAVLHIDFLRVIEDQPVSIGIPVVTTGFAEGVQAGGKQKIEMRRLRVKALAKDLPDELTIDVTSIGLGQSIKVRDLDFDNLELEDPKSTVVVSVKLTRVAKGLALDEEEETEEEEGEEGATEETTTEE